MLESVSATRVFDVTLSQLGSIACHLQENLKSIPCGNIVWATVREDGGPIQVGGTKVVGAIKLGTTVEVLDAIREKPNHLFVLARYPDDAESLPEVEGELDSPAARFSAVVDPMLEEQSSSLIVCIIE